MYSLRRIWRYHREVIRICTSKKKRQHNGQRKSTKGQRTTYKHTHKTKDRVTRTPLRTGGELRCSGMVTSSCSTSDTRRVNTCITSSAKYFGHIQDENKFWNIEKLYRTVGEMGETEQRLPPGKRESWTGTNNWAWCIFHLWEIYKQGI
jgi:hypothetical protein